MTFPNGLKHLPPEADLRSVVVRRREKIVPPEDTARPFAHSEKAAGLFFSKGQASAQTFRPAYWKYDDSKTDETPIVPDIRMAAGGELEAAAIEALKGDGASASGARTVQPPPQLSPMDSYLASLERNFLANQLRELMQVQEPVSDRDAHGAPDMPHNDDSDIVAPEADLRSIQLRRTPVPTTQDDGLFLQKNQGGPTVDEAPPVVEAPRPIPIPVAETHTVADEIAKVAPSVVSDLREFRTRLEPDKAPVVSGKNRRKGRNRRPSAMTTGAGILAAGFASLVVALWVLFDVNSPQTQVDVAVSLPKILAPTKALPPPPVAQPVAPPVVTQAAPPVAPAIMAPIVVPPIVVPSTAPHSQAVENFLAEGNASLRNGDVYTARLFFERAADAGDAHGALMMGVTFDPNFLSSIGVRGLRGDETAALSWYRRATALGAPEAAKLISNLPHN